MLQWKILLFATLSIQFAWSQDDAERFLLPGNLKPVFYNLTLYPHIERFQAGIPQSFRFEGVNIITVTAVTEDVSDVIINSYDDIVILEVTVTALGSDDQPRTVKIGNYDSATNKQSIQVDPPLLENNTYSIAVNYSGINNNDLTGFYRSSYYVGLQRRWLVVTDFEPVSARRAFPCLDEPALKAPWQLKIAFNQTLYDSGYIPHFNTQVESEQEIDGLHITTFQVTPRPISSYLICVILADFLSSPEPTYFESSYNGENGTKPFWTVGQSKFFDSRQDLISQIAGPATLNFVTQKTGVGYGFNKVEQVGIPDFSAGAMENWGLVTYRENLVFWNEQTGSTRDLEDVVTVTAHELGHQWFGDLVTLHWWSDVWLNEGFATFFEFHASDQIREPGLDTSDWDLIGEFVEGYLQGSSFLVDAFSDEHPLTYEVYDPSIISNYFDTIAYDKGGCILRMFMHSLGEDLYYDGLSRYLKSRQEREGYPENLLNGFDEALNALPSEQQPPFPRPPSELFSVWHLESGYPVLNVERNGAVLNLTQERFLYDAALDTKYNIPLTYSSELENNFFNTLPVGFLQATETSTTLQIKDASASWIVLNNQETGYYRVNYDDDNWDILIDIISNSATADQIHPYNRAQIIDDLNSLNVVVHKDYVHISKALRALKALRHERNARVWRTGLRFLQKYYFLLHESEAFPLFKKYAQWLVEPAFNELSLTVRDSDSHLEKILRMDIARFACQIDIASCKEQAQKLLSNGYIHPDVRTITYCEGVKTGDRQMWNQVLDQALELDGPVRHDLLASLTCTEDEELFNKLQELILAEDVLSDVDIKSIQAWGARLNVVKAEKILETLANKRLKNNYELKSLVQQIVSNLDSEKALKSATTLGGAAARIVRSNSLWKSKRLTSVESWLKTSLTM